MQTLTAYRRVLARPDLRRFLPAVGVSALGDGMSMVVIAWLAITISPPGQQGWWTAFALAAFSMPATIGAFAFSRFVSRWRGARLVAADATLRMVALAVIAALGLAHMLTPGWYVALLGISSLLHAWGSAGTYTMIAELLPDEDHVPGNALLSTISQTTFIVGPAMAGILVPIIGPIWALGADAVSYGVLAAVAWGLSRRVRGGVSLPSEGGNWRALFRYPQMLVLVLVTCLFFLLYGPVEVALPIFVAQDKQGSAALLGAFWTVFGIGAVVGGLLAAALRNRPLWTVVAVIIIGWGAALLPLGLWGELVPGLIGFAVGGLIYGPFISITTALFQRTSPPELLSSVLATRGALTIPATALGTLLGGPLIELIGAQKTLLVSALLTIALGIAVAVTQVRSPQKGTALTEPMSSAPGSPNSRER